jgi:hypothetical protein
MADHEVYAVIVNWSVRLIRLNPALTTFFGSKLLFINGGPQADVPSFLVIHPYCQSPPVAYDTEGSA